MSIRQNNLSTSQFVEEFQKTTIPSSIPNEDFIDWKNIEEQIGNYEAQIEKIQQLRDVSEKKFEEGIANALIEAENTREWMDFYFELLGERGTKYVAKEGVWKFHQIKKKIEDGDKNAARDLADVLQDVGLQYVVDNSEDVRDQYRGMLVGMETHSRKNRQGTLYENLVGEKLREIVDELKKEGHNLELDDEHETEYDDDSGQTKTVDFAILEDGELRVVFEANCYKGGGSKPSEIRRSYNRVAERMRDDGIAFVWITDGQGWKKSLNNVLKESYKDITDVYNLYQAEEQLLDDVKEFLES